MTPFRRVNDQLSVSPQITTDLVQEAAAAGFKTIICNRPDGEEADMTLSADIAQKADELGLKFVYLPFAGPPPADIVAQQSQIIDSANEPVLAYCRSGTRSVTTWALGKTSPEDRQAAIKDAADAGYDLSSLAI